MESLASCMTYYQPQDTFSKILKHQSWMLVLLLLSLNKKYISSFIWPRLISLWTYSQSKPTNQQIYEKMLRTKQHTQYTNAQELLLIRVIVNCLNTKWTAHRLVWRTGKAIHHARYTQIWQEQKKRVSSVVWCNATHHHSIDSYTSARSRQAYEDFIVIWMYHW